MAVDVSAGEGTCRDHGLAAGADHLEGTLDEDATEAVASVAFEALSVGEDHAVASRL